MLVVGVGWGGFCEGEEGEDDSQGVSGFRHFFGWYFGFGGSGVEVLEVGLACCRW